MLQLLDFQVEHPDSAKNIQRCIGSRRKRSAPSIAGRGISSSWSPARPPRSLRSADDIAQLQLVAHFLKPPLLGLQPPPLLSPIASAEQQLDLDGDRDPTLHHHAVRAFALDNLGDRLHGLPPFDAMKEGPAEGEFSQSPEGQLPNASPPICRKDDSRKSIRCLLIPASGT